MYLLPTSEELNELWRQIDPKQRFLRAARQAINEACRFDDSMAAFYLDSQDADLIMEDDAMPYFDEIEDDIISMRRDINGFKLSPPRYLEYARGTDSVNFKGWSFETVRDDGKPDTKDCPYVENLSSWDDF